MGWWLRVRNVQPNSQQCLSHLEVLLAGVVAGADLVAHPLALILAVVGVRTSKTKLRGTGGAREGGREGDQYNKCMVLMGSLAREKRGKRGGFYTRAGITVKRSVENVSQGKRSEEGQVALRSTTHRTPTDRMHKGDSAREQRLDLLVVVAALVGVKLKAAGAPELRHLAGATSGHGTREKGGSENLR